MSAPAGWLASAGGAALAAGLELDAVQVGQFMVSRPIVVGALFGLLFADAQQGLILGCCCELLSLASLPLGASLPLNSTIATAVAVLMACGPARLPPAAALPVGFVAGWVHQQIETALRHGRRTLNTAVESSVRERGVVPWRRMTLRNLAQQAAVNIVVMLFWALAAGPALHRLWPHLPAGFVQALNFAWAQAPWMGLGVAFYAFGMRP